LKRDTDTVNSELALYTNPGRQGFDKRELKVERGSETIWRKMRGRTDVDATEMYGFGHNEPVLSEFFDPTEVVRLFLLVVGSAQNSLHTL
jgi:hypothetical protein